MDVLLGIDIGTSACKIAVFNRRGEVCFEDSEPYHVYYPKTGWAEQNPEDWWNAVCKTTKRLFQNSKIKPEDICGIGIDGQSWSAIAVDKEGEVLLPTPIWLDTRSEKICKNLESHVGEDNIFRVAGNMLKPQYSTGKVLWYKETYPAVYAKTEKIMQSNSFIAYRLTGNIVQDHSQGYAFHCYDMKNGVWDTAMAGELGISMSLLPELVNCTNVIGKVSYAASQRTGLKEGTPVVAGGLDAACGTLGVGVYKNGQTQEQGGQAGGMSICIDRYVADKRLILSPHVTGNGWLLQGGTTGGGGALRWFDQEFGDSEKAEADRKNCSSFDILGTKAAGIDAGSDGVIFLPYMNGERSPLWDKNAKGVFYGLDFSKKKAHLIRATMEGVAYALRHNLEVAVEAGASVNSLHAMGGSANSVIWTQIKADVVQKRIKVFNSDTASTLGAALLAGIGVGMYKDYEQAVETTIKMKREQYPDREKKIIYDKGYRVYRSLYENLKILMNSDSSQ